MGNSLDFCHSHQLSSGTTAPEAQGVYSHFWSAKLFLVKEVYIFPPLLTVSIHRDTKQKYKSPGDRAADSRDELSPATFAVTPE